MKADYKVVVREVHEYVVYVNDVYFSADEDPRDVDDSSIEEAAHILIYDGNWSSKDVFHEDFEIELVEVHD